MRISNLLPLLALAACGEPEQERARAIEAREVAEAPKFFCAQGDGELVAQAEDITVDLTPQEASK